MPCYQIVTATVEFKISNIDLLKKALENLKLNAEERYGVMYVNRNLASIDLKKGTISSQLMAERDLTNFSNSIKRAYSNQVLDELAKKNKWIKKNLGNNNYQLQRF